MGTRRQCLVRQLAKRRGANQVQSCTNHQPFVKIGLLLFLDPAVYKNLIIIQIMRVDCTWTTDGGPAPMAACRNVKGLDGVSVSIT
jgi:hypothetical protein